jgi:hypothetical protein
LAEVPAEAEWFANIANAGTRRIYQHDIQEFMRLAGTASPLELRTVKRAHVIAWRRDLEHRGLGGATIRRKLAALSSLFEYLCESNAVTHNPVKGVKRPKIESYEGKTPAVGDQHARMLLEAPVGDSVKRKRDRAIMSALLYHALRRRFCRWQSASRPDDFLVFVTLRGPTVPDRRDSMSLLAIGYVAQNRFVVLLIGVDLSHQERQAVTEATAMITFVFEPRYAGDRFLTTFNVPLL